MGTLHLAARLYIAAVTIVAIGAAAFAVAWADRPGGDEVALGLTVVAFMTAAFAMPVPFVAKTKLYLDTSVLLAAILLFPPGQAMLIAGAGTLLGHLVRREPWYQAIFNAAQAMLQAAAGGLILQLFGWDAGEIHLDRPELLLAIALAAVAMALVNTIAIATIVALQTGQSPWEVWYRTTVDYVRSEYLLLLAQWGIGLLAAVIAAASVWALGLLVLPGLAVRSALMRHAQRRQRAELALRDSEANLKVAQRIAQLGSWDWDIASDRECWSDELRRIVGVTPSSNGNASVRFVEAVHPDDRPLVDQAIHRSLASGIPFSLDHRILRLDGVQRVVRHQGDVVFGAGKPVRLVGTVLDITERKALEEQLAHQAFHDPLTELPNRVLFADRLEHALARAAQRGDRIAILFIDLDRFKLVNDTLGHEAGDQVLVAAAERLRQCTRPADTIARLGGDEFTILLEDVTDAEDATRLANVILANLSSPFAVGNQEAVVTVSIGIALSTPGHSTALELLRDADVALYRAKDKGKARHEIFDPSMRTVILRRVDLEAALRRALEQGQFRVQYQPTVELASGRIVGMEALLRWVSPDRGLVLPGEFVPLAEETGLILPIGRFVLEEACKQAALWQERYSANAPTLSINLSPRQFVDGGLVGEVEAVLRSTGLRPQNLSLEITEGMVMDEQSVNVTTLQELRALGIRIAIDDFGIGYSSLSYLRRLPIDILKIDQSFIAGLSRGGDDATIAEAVINLGRALRLEVVAEGVENREQLTRLRSMGCRFGQGYYLSKPLTADATDDLVQRGYLSVPDRPRLPRRRAHKVA
jgi:diguanylate cyclase (GGDEF)-like protein/PAS domain S-box-containing protein